MRVVVGLAFHAESGIGQLRVILKPCGLMIGYRIGFSYPRKTYSVNASPISTRQWSSKFDCNPIRRLSGGIVA